MLSRVQLEAVVYALQQHERMLPSGQRVWFQLGIAAFLVPVAFAISPELLSVTAPILLVAKTFVAAIAVLFSQAMLLFYLVGSGRRVRQVAQVVHAQGSAEGPADECHIGRGLRRRGEGGADPRDHQSDGC